MNLPGKYKEKNTLYYFFGTLSRFTRNSRGVCVWGDIIMLQSTLISSTDLRQKKVYRIIAKNVLPKHETQDLTQALFCAYWLIALCQACVNPSFSSFVLFAQRKALTLNLTSRRDRVRYLLSLFFFFLTSSPCICKGKNFACGRRTNLIC